MGPFILEVGRYVFDIYYWLIFIFILGSWFPQFHSTKIGTLIGKLVDPYLSIFRRFIPPLGVIDISALLGILAYSYIASFALIGLNQVFKLIGL